MCTKFAVLLYYVIVGLVRAYSSPAASPPSSCNVVAQTESGWVCGRSRRAEASTLYASFRGVPYAKQPVGELRFKELQPAEPWTDYLDATEEGPVCYQTDVLYGSLMKPHGMNEACIYANIHVPLYALPAAGETPTKPGLPILVFIHGGGFAFGSGDADLYGPEYLVTRNVVVITFNYRLNFFGFFSLDTPKVPGNNGLRDMVTLLRWVKRNARAFGGNPDNVTLAGQSAGAAAAHLLTLSKATEGLVSRAILMSGAGTSTFFTTSPIFSQSINKLLFSILGVNSTNPDEIHEKLVAMPVEKLNEANRILIDQIGLTTFFPVVETPHPGITTILDEDPNILVQQGRGKDIPLIIGFTNSECHMFQRRFEQIDIVSKINENPAILVPSNLLYSSTPETIALVSNQISQRYFNGSVDLEGFINMCTDSYYKYPAMKLAEKRSAAGDAPVFLYQFSYDGYSVFKQAFHLHFNGAGHADDLTYVLKVNSASGTSSSQKADDEMKYWMTTFVTNFMRCSAPMCDETTAWPPVTPRELQYQDIITPNLCHQTSLTKEQLEMKNFFDKIHNGGESRLK